MKASCMQENLARGLSIVGRAVAARTTLPVLSNVLLSTEGSRLKLASNNLEIGINHWINADIRQEGAITVPARMLASFVNTLPPERVDLEVSPRTQTLTVRCGRFKATFKGIDAQEFPATLFPEEGEATVSLPAEGLRQMINRVAFAAATDNAIRPALTGVLVEGGADHLTFAAADSYRLSVSTMPLEYGPETLTSVIIPARTLQELRRILGDAESVTVGLNQTHTQVFFRFGTTALVSQLIEGPFPDYKQIIPKTYKTRIVTDTANLLKAVRMASIFARDSRNICELQVEVDDNGRAEKMTLAAASSEFGDNTSELEANITGEPISIAFNVHYLVEAISVIDTPEVALETRDPTSPGVICPVGGTNFIHIIMPMIAER